MGSKFDGEDPDTAELLLPMALATLKFQPTLQEAKRLLANLLFRVAHHYARNLKRPRIAMQHLERCLDLRRQNPDNQNKNLVQETERAIEDARNQLSEADKGTITTVAAPSRTKRLSQELKQLKQGSGGKDHYDTIQKVSELAAEKLTTDSGRSSGPKDAAALYQRALAWCKTSYGKNNMDTSRPQYNLALAHEKRGEYDQAEALYLSASRIVEQHLGSGNPKLLRILRSVALLQCRRQNLDAATHGLVAVLRGQVTALGYNHPDTLVTRQNFAMLLEEQGHVDAAGEELERVVEVQVYLLGRDDPATLQTACSLALNYRLRGRPQDAETLFRATLNHRDAVTTDLMLRELLQEMGKAEEA